ncbi:MAG: hypothetical protein IIX47_07690, partial [Spirochaetaceae bacterium]|nr:hypothetical protein [Spirochaetaceae bacterium]
FNVGDILFTDGTRIKAENVKYGVPDSQMDKAFGVVAYTLYGGATGKAVGLQKSSSTLMWARSGTTGYNTKFTEIQAGYSNFDYIDGKYTNYVFTGDMDGSDNWEEICKVDLEGTQDAATNYPAFNFALKYGETAGLTETKYETGWYIPSVAELYDVYTNKEVVQTSLTAAGGFTIGTGYYWSSSQYDSDDFSACRVGFSGGSVSIFSNNHKYYVLVVQAFNAGLFNNYEITTTPSITSVTIPTAGEGYTGELPVTIMGENLKGHVITSSDSTFANVRVLSETKATATITCNGVVGESSITVTSGSFPFSGTVKVVEKAKCYSVGDIILADGSKVSVNDVTTYTIDENKKPIGVIASALYSGGTGKAVGLQKSSSSLAWAPSGTTGYRTNFTEIKGTTTSGDMDGSDNWEEICKVDPEGTADAATNYPVFNFALNYGETAGLTDTDYETGWYIPSVAELYDVYRNKEVVQTSLTAVGGFTLKTSYYWSSSQSGSYDYYAWGVYFYDGTVFYDDSKDDNSNVLVFQAFNAE